MTVAPRSQPLAFQRHRRRRRRAAQRRQPAHDPAPARPRGALRRPRACSPPSRSPRAPSVDLTSVYRNLELLEELGVVRHVHVGHGPSVYGLVGDGEREFLVCEACGKVVAVDPEQLDRVRAVIRDDFGLEARFTHFPIHGRCADCR